MIPKRFPFWRVATIALWFIGACFMAAVIWAAMMLAKPVTAVDLACMAWSVAGLVWAVLQFDRYTFAREHLMAERKLTREHRALLACALIVDDRFYRGQPIRGTPLHQTAIERQRRARDALNVAMWFRERR